jgi:hypothetical protein
LKRVHTVIEDTRRDDVVGAVTVEVGDRNAVIFGVLRCGSGAAAATAATAGGDGAAERADQR